MNFAKKEAMIPKVAPRGENREDEMQKKEEAGHGAEAETGEVDAKSSLPHDSTGHQVDERNLEICRPKKAAPTMVGMLAMNDYCDLLHHYYN